LNFYYAVVSWLIFHGQGGCFIVQKVIHICAMGEEKIPYELERDVRVAELAKKLLPVQKAAEDFLNPCLGRVWDKHGSEIVICSVPVRVSGCVRLDKP
jgi:hypothetical protein